MNSGILTNTSDALPPVQYVIEIDIRNCGAAIARARVVSATQVAEAGTAVRLKVGRVIPTWLFASMRVDMRWQILAEDAGTLRAWRDYIEEGVL